LGKASLPQWEQRKSIRFCGFRVLEHTTGVSTSATGNYANLPETHAIGQPRDNRRLGSNQNSRVSTIRQTAN